MAFLAATALGQGAGIYVNEVPTISNGGLVGGALRPTGTSPSSGPSSPVLPPFALGPDAPTLSTSFDCFDFDDNPVENGGFYSIPPDPIGAAGPDRVIAVVNTMIEARTKAGVLLYRDALADFFLL
jgi:hypothetical protein